MLIDTGSESKKNIWQDLLIIVFLFITNSYALAQTATIKSLVLDKITKEPLTGANVIIQGTSLGAAADLDGRFIIRNVPIGKQTLVISYIGYNSLTIELNVSSSGIEEQRFYLEPKTLEGETVVITAQAEGQLSAINQQLTSNTIANIVAKDRIKELPDVNAAETIGRLPGVSIERFGGEATKVSIRGLSPKYNLITVNGVRLPSTGDYDRSVDLSLISSNMLDGIILKKANTPDMDADVIGGTVDLKLKEAPEKFLSNLSAQWGYNRLQSYYGNYNFTGSVSNRFFDSELGVIVNFNLDNYDRSADKFNGEWAESNDINNQTVVIPSKIILREETVNRDRAGGSLFLDYRIPSGKLTANSFYSNLASDNLIRINSMILSAPGESNRHYYEMEDRGGNTSIFTGALGVEQDFSWMQYDFSGSLTNTKTSNPNERTWRFNQEANAFSTYNFPAGTDPRIIPQYANIDTSLTRFAEVWIWDTNRKEKESSTQFNLKFPVSFGNDISGYFKTGAKFRWMSRNNDVEYHGRNGIQYGGSGNEMLKALDNAFPTWGIDSLVKENGWLPISIFLDNYSRSNFLNGDYALGFTVNETMLNQVTDALNNAGLILPFSINSLGSDYDGVEHYQAAYLMGEFKLWNMFTLIPGLRFENEYTKYTGFRFREVTINNIQGPPTDLDTLTAIRSHNFLLPMIHLIIEPTDWMKVRLARTQTLTRPDFLQFTPITRINSGQDYIRANNTKLKPSVSTNYDIAVSVYENYVGLFSVSAFYKDIKDLIFQSSYKFLRGVPVPEGANIPQSWLGSAPNADIFINNPDKAFYKGFEIEWQTRFWYLPSFLNGFVLNLNYTNISSEVKKWLPKIVQDTLIRRVPPVWSYKVVDSSRVQRMPDQPRHIFNVTLGYDYKGFSARLSFLFQTDKVSYIASKPQLDAFTSDYARWDFTVQQKLDWGIQLFANFTNLNSREDRSYIGTSPRTIEYYGFTMDVGLRYNL
jgi:TonB-dependent receptor